MLVAFDVGNIEMRTRAQHVWRLLIANCHLVYGVKPVENE